MQLKKKKKIFGNFFEKNVRFWAIFRHSNGNFPEGQMGKLGSDSGHDTEIREETEIGESSCFFLLSERSAPRATFSWLLLGVTMFDHGLSG